MTIPRIATLRDYQREGVEAVVEAWNRGVQRPAIVLATGLGKTVIMSQLVTDCVTVDFCRPVILVHRDELVRQTVDKLVPHAHANGFTVGVIQAGRHEVNNDVVVASVQTLTRRLGDGEKSVPADRFDMIITDECHHGSAESYLRIYDHFGGRDQGPRAGRAKMLGVTATLARGDGVPLGHVWQEVCFERDIQFGIDHGHLVKPFSYQIFVPELDGKLKSHHGDWSDADLGAKMIAAGHRIGEAILKHGKREDGTLRRGITFAPTVACAQSWAAEFNRMGIESRLVIGDTEHEMRQAIYRATHRGAIDMIVSVMCLTEGFDLPAVEMAVIGRPTKKLPLYVQMVGRVLRPSEHTEKQDALILDVRGVMQHPLPKCLADLDLPITCDCPSGCDCTWRYLCMGLCDCPLEECTCDQKIGCNCPPERPVLHVEECTHRCRIGAPPVGEARATKISEDEISMLETDLFAETREAIAKRGIPWMLTNGGIPFLPGRPGSANPMSVFLWEMDDQYQVGSFGGDGGVVRHGEPMPKPEAVLAALKLYGPKPRPLVGPATEAQMQMFGLPEGLTRQEASDRISVITASGKLDV